jgi:hypothetical protein
MHRLSELDENSKNEQKEIHGKSKEERRNN